MIGGGVDVGHHGVDCGIGFGHQRGVVFRDRFEAADRLPETEHGMVAFGHGRVGAFCGTEAGAVGRRQACQGGLQPRDAAAPDVGLSQQEVSDYANERQSRHNHHPGNA